MENRSDDPRGFEEYQWRSQWTVYATLALLSLVLLSLRRSLSFALDPREPPLVKPTIPVIGHVVGMWRKGGGYYLDLNDKLKGRCDAATLNIFGQKFYVIFSPALAQFAFRNRHLSVDTFNIQAADGVVRLSAQAKHVLEHTTILHDFVQAVPAAMAPEPLRRMTSTALRALSADLKELAATDGHEQRVPDLYHLLRRMLVLATTDALYGALTNPFRKDLSLTDDVWEFDEAMFRLFWNVAPNLIAPAGHRSRQRLQEALISYFRAYPHENAFPEEAAEFTRLRARLIRDAGLSDVDLGRMEVGMVHVAASNSAPMLFWLIANVFARPDVVEKIRAEVASLAEFEERPNIPQKQATLRASQLTDQALCPYLAAVHRETLRLADSITGTRFVVEDITLPDGTLLKAGGIVHLPSAVAHRMPDVWGPQDPGYFEPARLLDGKAGTKASGSGGVSQKTAFWPFGGGRHLCPGRNFALAENITLLAALVTGFEIDGLDEKTLPRCPFANLTGQSVAKPEHSVKVTVRRRRGWEDVEWQLLA